MRSGGTERAAVTVNILKRHPGWKWIVPEDGEERAYLEDLGPIAGEECVETVERYFGGIIK